ncbi:MAG: 50S ribosomal protein L30 [Pseudodesulfovibrio sp.]|uniref:50S ribosomal protein L30 n=1 Tax=Pseudodesulfovibrio aespoeensis (strain ATCC 700646 / DSM 10631 / Aspo-2) TaxID=643562 RepID=E6VT83_PSEA9|nr:MULTISPECIES: 50S ribosomal protein L30 [Pseudodesulfovibrio]MBU4243283.1 50S ribosomal protein L30 [Pseudomonadota bacterium]MCG2733021.1 50S ribosomal protein L30 [Pseudodesulfovibrio aespoeensis]ADU63242.1 ribosomal protein L30 [Pseudodesulfovibrio aespoeensis Aspo-2]MBU4379811.1 50S ribosomal protein L30 [Pseudomonadota bacterium]MBU4475139.1 50S ribosomal protein L30 [Pseudomonadota bacterium]
MLKVKLIKSRIAVKPSLVKTLDSLGLRRIRQEKTHEDNPVIRGMIYKVRHLVEVTES